MKGLTLANGGSKANRRELDFYPTPPKATHAIMAFLNLPISCIWEPACGNGAMSEVIKKYNHDVISSDIRDDTGYGTGKIDFLHGITPKKQIDAIITNPPFYLSVEFIIRAISIAPTVAMLLKSQYWHSAKRIDLFNNHPPSFVLPLSWRPDFGGGGAPTMDVLWTVWQAGISDTKYRILSKPNKGNQDTLSPLR